MSWIVVRSNQLKCKGGEGASVCVADVLGEVLSVCFLIRHDTHLAGSIVAIYMYIASLMRKFEVTRACYC